MVLECISLRRKDTLYNYYVKTITFSYYALL